MTYGEFLSLSANLALSLERNGLGKGDRAAIVSENRPEWCASYAAILMRGGIAVPIDAQLGQEEIRNLLLDSGAKVVFYSSKTEANVSDAVGENAISRINFDALTVTPPVSPLLQGETGRVVCSPVSPDDIASIIYTSGTTGKPKGVMLTHGNFCSDAAAVIKAEVVAEYDNVLSILPLHHTYPFMCAFLVPAFAGASITFGPGLKAGEIISAIKDRGVTVALGVPRLFEMIRNGIVSKIKEKKTIAAVLPRVMRSCGQLRRKSGMNIGKILFKSVHRNFGRVRFFASGGARLDPSVMEDLEAMGFTVLEGYGLTETSPVVTFNPLSRRKPGSAGKPLPGVEIKISGDGEIMIKGAMVMKGYYKNRSATDDVIKDEWLLTGDTGYMDGEGYLFITGRKKEVIVLSSGKNIYPEDVEKAYMIIPLIKEMCVFGVDRNGVADSIHAVVVPDVEYAKKESIGNITEALNWAISETSSKLPEYMRIKGYTIYTEPLPRTPLGKLRRFMVSGLLKSRQRAERLEGPEDAALSTDETGRTVANAVKALMDRDVSIRAADNLELDLGFDSLKKIELASFIESAFDISLPEKFISEAQTVGDVVSKIREHMLAGARHAGIKEDAGAVSWRDIFEQEPSPEDSRWIGYSHGIIETAVVLVLFFIHKMLFKILFRLRVEGIESIPPDKPFVIAPNHASYLDGFAIAAAVPFSMFRKLYFLGLQQYFAGGVKSWFARLCHVIPIDSETYLHKALQLSAFVLKSRKSLCIFPEGGRSFDGSIMPFKKGIGVLALELGIAVVPAYIEGAFDVLPRGAKFIRPAAVRIVFGKPFSPGDIAADIRGGEIDRYQSFADKLRQNIITLSRS